LTIRTLTLAVALFTTVAAVAESTYQVRRGDTLSKISHKLGVPVEALRKANNLDHSAHLSRGQILTIPSASASESVSAQPIGQAEVIDVTTTPHAGPFDGSRSLDPVGPGESFKVFAQKPGWMQVKLPTGLGWLSSDLLKFTSAPSPAPVKPVQIAVVTRMTRAESTAAVIKKVANSDNQLLKKALTYRGVRYRWGGTSRSSGVDCSGFTTSVFSSQGIKLPRTAIEQSQVGHGVSKSDLKPGDLVFFRTSRSYRVNHVGIYVGEGKFMHAATGAGHVMVSSLDEKYYLRCYATARRVADFQIASRAAAASRAATEN
jgi:cell wall-associated NlpC family hydrolase